MRQLEVGRKKISVPESWGEIPLGTYIQASKMLKQYQGIPRRAIGACVASLCGISEAQLMAMQIEDIEAITAALGFYFDTAPEPNFVDHFERGGIMFQVPSSIESATFGEFIDMDTEVINHKDDLKAAVPGILSIYCRPQGERYQAETQQELETRLTERRKIMSSLPMPIAEGLAAFFLTSVNASLPITAQFGQSRVSLISRVRLQASLLKSTGGWQRLCNLPKIIFLWWMRSRLSRSTKY